MLLTYCNPETSNTIEVKVKEKLRIKNCKSHKEMNKHGTGIANKKMENFTTIFKIITEI